LFLRCNHLSVPGKNGAFAYIGNRGDEAEHREIKPMFDLGHTRFVFYSPKDVDSMREVIADADIVVNLISKTHETGQPIQVDKFPYLGWQTNHTFWDMNVGIAKQIAELCAEMQVDHLIHVSSAAASRDHPSEWARTKYAGELAVKKAFPWATIVRPTQLFGSEDKFLHFYANMAKFYRFVPLCEGGQALTQPVWCVDVAKTINRITDDPKKFEGRTVDCFGPSDYTHEELAKFVLDLTEQDRRIVNLPALGYKAFATVMGFQQMITMNPDVAELWMNDYLPAMTAEEYKAQPKDGTEILTMEDLGITATPIEKEAFHYLHRFRLAGHFGRTKGYHNDPGQEA
jgi:NADH dehydrogenase (ubiquinone) 1 alpha subcomplex subunit 9